MNRYIIPSLNFAALKTFILSAIMSVGIASPAFAKPVTNHGSHHATGEIEARPFDKTRDAQKDVARTLADAKRFNKRSLIILGANWCHDSRALATHFERPHFQSLLNTHYKVAYVDVGKKNRNIDIARQFGLEAVEGTPTVFVLNAKGQVLNAATAPTWRNAASRTENEIWTYFVDFATSTQIDKSPIKHAPRSQARIHP